jgi:type I restriction enzyme M protein
MPRRHAARPRTLEALFLRLEELVLASSGEDEFEEVFKLLIAKLWDERSGAGLFRGGLRPEEAAQAVGELLGRAAQGWPGVLEEPAMRLRPGHVAVCVEVMAPLALADASFEALDAFFEFLVARAVKGAKGQFFTPRHVVELCVRLVQPRAGEVVLDPACGSGGFLVHAWQRGGARSEGALWGLDVDARAARVARALLVLSGASCAGVRQANSLLEAGEEQADVILTNPPFAGDVREPALLAGYELAAKRRRVERDVLFVERCLRWLRPGGRMAMVLPHNKFAARSLGYLRAWLLERARVVGVVGLGRHTFLPHTHQKAAVLLLEKRGAGPRSPDPRVFFAISERDGKDARGNLVLRGEPTLPPWERIDHDFDEILGAFEGFLATEGLSSWR